jgi:membrane protease YdiL (CAAX protease family)
MKAKSISITTSYAIFIIAAVVLFLHTHILIPLLSDLTGIEPILFWFINAGLGIFLPLLIAGWLMLTREGALKHEGVWTIRLRFTRMNTGDWLWTIGAIMLVGLLSGAIMTLLEAGSGGMETQPPFMHMETLGPGRYWILAVWLPYWLLNIMGEEIFWRGVLQPRMEAGIGRHAWLHHGLGWSIFHLSFGWQLLLTMLPLLFLLPWIVQRRQNSWPGVVMHAVINGPAFILIALGLL